MTREEFIKVLDEKGFKHYEEGDSLVVDHDQERSLHLNSLTSLPPNIVFRNSGDVWLDGLDSLPSGIRFENSGEASLRRLRNLPFVVEFNNGRDVSLYVLPSLPPGMCFKNEHSVLLTDLKSLPSGTCFQNRGRTSLNSIKRLPLEDMDTVFPNPYMIKLGPDLIYKEEFPEYVWTPVRERRVKTFESFTYNG